MTQPLTLPALERGQVRVFSLSMSAAEARHLDLEQAFGLVPSNPDRIEIFPVSNLDGVGLAGYLTQGCGIPETQVAPDRARLDALDGHVLVLHSRAFGDDGATVTPAPELTLIGTYAEARTDMTPLPPLDSDAARPSPGQARRAAPRQTRAAARRAGAIVFTVVLLVLLLLLIWVF